MITVMPRGECNLRSTNSPTFFNGFHGDGIIVIPPPKEWIEKEQKCFSFREWKYSHKFYTRVAVVMRNISLFYYHYHDFVRSNLDIDLQRLIHCRNIYFQLQRKCWRWFRWILNQYRYNISIIMYFFISYSFVLSITCTRRSLIKSIQLN